MKIEPWICLNRETVFEKAPWLEIEKHHLRLPNGQEIPDWLWVRTPDFINVVAVNAEGKILCFRQQKAAVEGVTLAIPGGYLEPGEDPQSAAVRELREEAGLSSEQWTPLGNYAVDGNRGCGKGHFFLAENCLYAGGEVKDDLEDQESCLLSIAEVTQALFQGEFGVMPWVAALGLALLRIHNLNSKDL